MMLGTILKRLQQPSLAVTREQCQIHESVAKSAVSFRRIATVEQLQLEYTQ